jgi:hypothetical protein
MNKINVLYGIKIVVSLGIINSAVFLDEFIAAQELPELKSGNPDVHRGSEIIRYPLFYREVE